MLREKDKKIIAELKKNSRASIRDIAAAIGSRPSTVHLRIKRLVEKGAIEKFTVKLNNEMVDESLIVFVFIRTDEQIPNEFFKSKAVKEAFGITGEYDICLKCKFKDINEFNDFIMNLRNKQNLRRTQTMVSTVVIKEEI